MGRLALHCAARGWAGSGWGSRELSEVTSQKGDRTETYPVLARDGWMDRCPRQGPSVPAGEGRVGWYVGAEGAQPQLLLGPLRTTRPAEQQDHERRSAPEDAGCTARYGPPDKERRTQHSGEQCCCTIPDHGLFPPSWTWTTWLALKVRFILGLYKYIDHESVVLWSSSAMVQPPLQIWYYKSLERGVYYLGQYFRGRYINLAGICSG